MSTLIKHNNKWLKVAGGGVLPVARKPAWSQAVAITSLPYTCPSDGMIVGANGYGTPSTLSINGVTVSRGIDGSDYNQIQCIVSKGDILSGIYGTASLSFVPFKYSYVSDIDEITPEYIRNQNILSDYEAVTITPFIAQYDGIINFMSVQGASGSTYILVNNVRIADMGSNNVPTGTSCGFSASIIVKKGDTITFTQAGSPVPTVTGNARWYKLRDYRGR